MAWIMRKRAQTGWQSLALPDGVTGTAAIRRDESMVQVMLDSVRGLDGNATVCVIPTGFGPVAIPKGMNQRNGIVCTTTGVARPLSYIATGRALRVLSAQASDTYSGVATWVTDEAVA